uniref:Uncharacterized protein n=1 Tax=Arundo donax TaxID=35708 RepID=A0A0A9BR90_ARUDO
MCLDGVGGGARLCRRTSPALGVQRAGYGESREEGARRRWTECEGQGRGDEIR